MQYTICILFEAGVAFQSIIGQEQRAGLSSVVSAYNETLTLTFPAMLIRSEIIHTRDFVNASQDGWKIKFWPSNSENQIETSARSASVNVALKTLSPYDKCLNGNHIPNFRVQYGQVF